MKQRKRRRIISKKTKKINCDFCQKIMSSLKDYQKHVYKHIECKRNLPYSCQFCPCIGYEQNGLLSLQCKPTCDKFYNEKPVTIDIRFSIRSS